MKTQRSALVNYFARASMVCILIFTILVLALHVLRSQMNPFSHTISEYVLGPFGSLMTLGFISRGLGELFLVLGLAWGTSRGSRSWTGLVFLALATVCSFLVALFPGDFHNTRLLLIHSSSAFLGFGSLIVAALAWSQSLRKHPDFRRSALTSLVIGLLMLISLVSLVFSPSSLLGLTERVLEIFIISWLGFMAWRLPTLASSQALLPA